MAEAIHLDVEEGNTSYENYPSTQESADGFLAKVTKVEYTMLIVNFILEIPSAVFDQLSSVHKPHYALVSMLMSYLVLLIPTVVLVLMGKKERVRLRKKGLIPWFYYPHPNDCKPFGKFFDMIGLVCAILQCVFTTIAYLFVSKKADNPIKLNFWPVIFAFGQLFTKISRNASQSSEPLPQDREALIAHTSRPGKPAKFTLAELTAATNLFSMQNKIGEGYFGDVYFGKLPDGREVAIHAKNPKFAQQKEMKFELELALLSMLNDKNLVELVGYCEDGDERFLLFEHRKNGSLCDHLHSQRNSSVINSWKMRIKIALDAARGIDYLHNHAIVSMIHRYVKSSNILLDANWNAGLSDFVLASNHPQLGTNNNLKDLATTLVYSDPEYLHSNVSNTLNDVYSFGIVLLEVLIGKRALFKDNDNGSQMTKLVDFAVPKILHGELFTVLDPRVGPPKQNEAEALELVASAAVHCLNLDGRKRPTMTDVVADLETSFSLCDISNDN